MFTGPLEYQLKMWFAIGLIIIPMGSILFGLILKPLTKKLTAIELSFKRSLLIQFCSMIILWAVLFFVILIGLTGIPQEILKLFNFIISIFGAAYVYSKMIKDIEVGSIGFRKGLIISFTMTGIAFLLNIPLKLLN